MHKKIYILISILFYKKVMLMAKSIDKRLLKKVEKEFLRRLRPSLKRYVKSSEEHIEAAIRYAKHHPKVAKAVRSQVQAAKATLVKLKKLVVS